MADSYAEEPQGRDYEGMFSSTNDSTTANILSDERGYDRHERRSASPGGRDDRNRSRSPNGRDRA